MTKETGPSDPLAGDADVPAPSERSALWQHPDEGEEHTESQSPVSLGPLGLLGFGPKPGERRRPIVSPAWAHLIAAAAVVILIAALKEAREVLVPMVVSAFVATLTAPVVLSLRKRKVPAAIAVPLVILLTLAGAAGVTTLVASSLNEFIQVAPRYQAGLVKFIVDFSTQLQQLGFAVDPSRLLSVVQPLSAIQFAAELVSQVADLFSSLLLILLLTVFVLFEALDLPDKIRRALGDPEADLSQGLRVIKRVQAYVVVKTYTSLATGAVIGLALHVMGVEFALLWGLIAFLLNFIPNLGSIIAAVPAIFMSLLQLGIPGATATALIFLTVNMIIGNLIEPRVMGRRMNLSPLIVFMSLIFWGWMWGPLGMLLSVPLTMVLRILLEGSPSTRPLAVLMAGSEQPTGSDSAPRSEHRTPRKS